MRKAVLLTTVVVASFAAAFADSEPAHDIVIAADVPSVPVAPRRPGRFAMRLPALTYVLRMNLECDDSSQANSVSVSVADSRVSFDADHLRDVSALKFELRIPSDQIAPVRIEEFCVGGDPHATAGEKLTIPAVLSAQASLRCTSELGDSMKYVTKPLDVLLECEVPAPVED